MVLIFPVEEDTKRREVIAHESEIGGAIVRSDSLATSDFSSPPTSPMSMSWSSASSPSSSLTGGSMKPVNEGGKDTCYWQHKCVCCWLSFSELNALRSANLVGMRHHFSVFITNVKKGLSTSDVEGFKSTLKTYYTNMPVLGDIESIITYLVNKNYWNYLNCEHLFLVIDTYGNDALKKEKKEFEKRRISYSVATKLQEYLSGRRDLLSYKKEATSRGRSSNKHRRSSSEYRGQLSMKLEIEVSH